MPFEINSSTFFSNGKTLNGTMVLPVHANRPGIRYGMIIGLLGGEYDSYIQQEKDGSSTKHVIQYIGYNRTYSRPLDIHGFTGSYDKKNGFVDLSMNLAKIGYPNRYNVCFFISNNRNQTLDQTSCREVPTLCELECVSVQIPSNESVYAGQQITVPIIIKAANASNFLYSNKLYFNETDNITLVYDKRSPLINLRPSPVPIPISGETLSDLLVRVSKDAPSGNYPLHLIEHFSVFYPKKALSPWVGSNTYSLDLHVLQPLPPLANIKNYLMSNSLLTISIPIIVTAVVSLLILRFVHINKSAIIKNLTIGEVIQIDGTVIVGVLILLTLGSTQFNPAGLHRTSLVVGVVTASIVYPFAISAMIVTTKGTVEHGIKLTFSGFVYLMVAVILLSLIQ
jgi:hypothetical protein